MRLGGKAKSQPSDHLLLFLPEKFQPSLSLPVYLTQTLHSSSGCRVRGGEQTLVAVRNLCVFFIFTVASGAAAGAAAGGAPGGARQGFLHSQQGACAPADPSVSRRKRRVHCHARAQRSMRVARDTRRELAETSAQRPHTQNVTLSFSLEDSTSTAGGVGQRR